MEDISVLDLNTDSIDSVKWALEKKGLFSTKSLYRFLTNRVSSKVAGAIWKSKLPLKINFFMASVQ